MVTRNVLHMILVVAVALLCFVISRVTLIGWLYDNLIDKFTGKIDGHTRLFCKTKEREIDCVVDIDIVAKDTSSKGCKLNYNNSVYELCGISFVIVILTNQTNAKAKALIDRHP